MKSLQQVGFTLVEMAIVMVIIGLLLTNSLRPLSSIVEQRRIKQTDQTLEDIKEALLGYTILHGRLPCPAEYAKFDGVNDAVVGREDTTLCDKEGYLPWVDLGVGRYDGWGNPFRYRAEEEYTGNGTPMDYSQIIVDQGNTGSGLRISQYIFKEDYDSLPTAEEKSAQWFASVNDSRIAVVIFSCGKNGRPDPIDATGKEYLATNDADGISNQNTFCSNTKSGLQNREYVYNFQVKDGDTILFDDQLTWLSRNTLMNRLILSKLWPPQP